jgi:hypothetical protein
MIDLAGHEAGVVRRVVRGWRGKCECGHRTAVKSHPIDAGMALTEHARKAVSRNVKPTP